jgi:hypothetical protein
MSKDSFMLMLTNNASLWSFMAGEHYETRCYHERKEKQLESVQGYPACDLGME